MAISGDKPISAANLKAVEQARPSGGSPLDAWPVGSIYMSLGATSPQDIFGGEWSKVEGRFLLCADSSHEAGTTGGSNDAVVVEHSHSGTAANNGGHSHTASIDSAGSHNHTISGGSHSHTASTNSAGSHTHAYPRYTYRTNPTPEGWDTTSRMVVQSGGISSSGGATSSSGSHSHTVTVSTTNSAHSHTVGSNGSHSHDVTVGNGGSHSHAVTVGSSGESAAGKNMPAYLAVNVWQRTA